MKKGNDNPISLFSFQDIITSLTGIMIIIILVIVLQLVETVSSLDAKMQPDEEYLQWKEEVQILQDKLRQLQEATGDHSSEERRKLFPLAAEDLTQMLKRENFMQQIQEQELANLNQEQKVLAANVSAAREECRDLQSHLEKLRQDHLALQAALHILTQQEQDITRLLTAIEERKRFQGGLEEQIKNLGTQLEFSFPGTLQRHPLLIECLEGGFCAVSYGQTDVQDFTQKGFSQNLSDLLAWLKTFNLQKTYPVLLYREAAFAKHSEIEEKILRLDSGVCLGREPIAADSKVF